MGKMEPISVNRVSGFVRNIAILSFAFSLVIFLSACGNISLKTAKSADKIPGGGDVGKAYLSDMGILFL